MIAVGAFLPWSGTYTQASGIEKVTGFATAGAYPYLVAWLGATLAVTALAAGKATNEAAIAPGMLGVVLCGYSWIHILRNSNEIVQRWVSDGLIISLAGSVVLTAIGVMAIIEGRQRMRRMHMTRPS
ncbi:hypothetical protein E1295_39655 [Nonomuraea mesophila]|uniref:Uncharacterized protein n=1 Tax=Nonomuraea mesophila TaxID=2530382 RepID=A0A4R5EDM3_9ACTN|nr:hypothetical protein [Nonomuraea mesophila]TDE32399.1 hypothetical protein E1295_39655 [Nonomuraea mesophila]